MTDQDEQHEFTKTVLRGRINGLILAARAHEGLSIKECFEIIEELYWALQGDNYLIEHHGGEEQVPPRLKHPEHWTTKLARQAGYD